MRLQMALIALVLVGVEIAAMAAQSDAKPTDNKPPATPSPEISKPTKPAAEPTYVIGADDTLHIDVWKEPDLTATLPVRPDGMISLPLLNDVQAAGLTPMRPPVPSMTIDESRRIVRSRSGVPMMRGVTSGAKRMSRIIATAWSSQDTPMGKSLPSRMRSVPNESMAQRNAGGWQWLTVSYHMRRTA